MACISAAGFHHGSVTRWAENAVKINSELYEKGQNVRTHQEDATGDGEVEGHASGLEADEHDLDVRVGLEGRDALVALLEAHAARELDALQAAALQPVRDDVQHVNELAEHDRLGAQVLALHLVQLL